VAGLVVGGSSRTGEDELTGIAAVVDLPANVVPDARLDLPLVDQPWRFAGEDQAGIDLGGFPCFPVNVEQYLALGLLPSGFRLATGFGALDKDRPGRPKAFLEL
jgi:hypothetical protein